MEQVDIAEPRCEKCDKILISGITWAPSLAKTGRCICKTCHNALNTARRAISISKGRCPYHPDRPAVKGKKCCVECVTKKAKLKQLGYCPNHPSEKPLAGKITCELCVLYRNKIFSERKQNGICVTHPNKLAVSGHVRCQDCVNNMSDKYEASRLMAIDALGGKCVHCDEPHTKFLTLGHINDDRVDWEKETGITSWSELHSWIIENPTEAKKIFQIECWNFNCSKAHWSAREIDYWNANKNPYNVPNPEIYHHHGSRYWRMKCLEHYGWRCACCGDDNPTHQTLGHPDGDGANHREDFEGNNYYLYKNVVLGGFKLKYKLETQCYDCNEGARLNAGVCPHKQQVN